MIWTRTPSLERLNQIAQGCMIGYLGIRYTRLEADELEAVMPVDERTRQPFGILHGGASVVLAETVGSAAGYLCTREDQRIVGLDINANHLHSVYEGWVRGMPPVSPRPHALGVGHSHFRRYVAADLRLTLDHRRAGRAERLRLRPAPLQRIYAGVVCFSRSVSSAASTAISAAAR